MDMIRIYDHIVSNDGIVNTFHGGTRGNDGSVHYKTNMYKAKRWLMWDGCE